MNGERYDFDRSVIESGVGLKEAWARALQTVSQEIYLIIYLSLADSL